MKIDDIKKSLNTEEEINMKEAITEHPQHGPGHPLPPHERKGMVAIRFDEKDWEIFKEVFGGEDEAGAAMGIIHAAPPEIQILAAQLISQIEKEILQIEKEAA